MLRWPDLLVSTVTALLLVRSGKVEEVETQRAAYYGITWNRDHIFVACAFRETTSKILTLNKWFDVLHRVNVPERNIHQLLWHDDKLFAALTERNAIGVINPKTGSVRTVYRTGGAVIDGVIGEDHVNSIWADTAGEIVICEHRQSTRFDRPSRIRFFDRGFSFRDEILIGRNAHNVYCEGGSLFINDSSNWRLIEVGLLDKEVRREVAFDAFPRGLARFEHGWVVGLSEDAPREARNSGSSRLVLLNDTWEVVEELVLKDCGGVHGVRVLGPQIDLAHNRIPFTINA